MTDRMGVMKITANRLASLGACRRQLYVFSRHFGDEVEVTEAVAGDHAKEFDWDWAAEHLLTGQARVAYQVAAEGAWADYLVATTHAMAGKNQTWAAYEKAMYPAWVAYWVAKATAFARATEMVS